MCDCVERIEKEYREHLKEKDPIFKDIDNFTVGFSNLAIMLNSGRTELTIPIEVNWKHTAKSGRVSNKTRTQSFTIGYCPFCGEKSEDGKKETPHANLETID